MNLESILADDGAWPDMAHELVFGDDLARRLNQGFYNLEGTRSNRHHRAAQAQFSPPEIGLVLLAFVDRSLRAYRHGLEPRTTPLSGFMRIVKCGGDFADSAVAVATPLNRTRITAMNVVCLVAPPEASL
jgi:hypothetical protein